MPHPVLGVDHSYLLVNDLDASAEHYRRLGFTLSPRGLHSPQKGTANYTIIFQNDYVELLGVINATDLNTSQRETLATYGEGLHAIANRTVSADAAKPALDELGILTGDVSAFSRPLPLPGGGKGVASFRTLGFDPSEVPLGHFFLCQHETRDMVWRPELQDHANGAIGLGGITGISDDPRATAETYAKFYAAGNIEETQGGFRVETGKDSAPLFFFTPAAIAKLYPGIDVGSTPSNGFAVIRVRVKNLERTASLLSGHGIRSRETSNGGIAVSPIDASGAVVEFI